MEKMINQETGTYECSTENEWNLANKLKDELYVDVESETIYFSDRLKKLLEDSDNENEVSAKIMSIRLKQEIQ